MARRIYRRGVSYNEVDWRGYEKLSGRDFYFAEFHGINTGRNYATIDQTSFVEAENIYVNPDGLLSTRPPLVETVFGSRNNYYDIKIINGVGFYYISNWAFQVVSLYTDFGKYFDLNDTSSALKMITDQRFTITEDSKIYWLFDKYIVFSKDKIWGFTLDSENKEVTFLTEDELIYIPDSYDLNANGEVNKNIFTPNVSVSVAFTPESVQDPLTALDDARLVGKPVSFTMEGVTYSTTWTAGRWRSFFKTLYAGNALKGITNLEFSKSGKYAVAYAYTSSDEYDVNTFDGFYFSDDYGVTFQRISNPGSRSGNVSRTICIAENEKGILYIGSVYDTGSKRRTPVYWSDMPTDGNYKFSWTDIGFDEIQNTYNGFNYSDFSGKTSKYCWFKPIITAGHTEQIAYCIDKDNWVVCSSCPPPTEEEFVQYWQAFYTNFTDNPTSTTDESGGAVQKTNTYTIDIVAKLNGQLNAVKKFGTKESVNTYLQGCSIVDVKLKSVVDKAKLFMDGDNVLLVFTHEWKVCRIFLSKTHGFCPAVAYGGENGSTSQGAQGLCTVVGTDETLGYYDYEGKPVELPPAGLEYWAGTGTNNKWYDIFVTFELGEPNVTEIGIEDDTNKISLVKNKYNLITDNNTTPQQHTNTTDLSKTSATSRASLYYKVSVPYNSQKAYPIATSSVLRSITISENAVLTDGSLYLIQDGSLKEYRLFKSATPIYVTDSGEFVNLTGEPSSIDFSKYLSTTLNNTLYKNGLQEDVVVRYSESDPQYNYLVPSFVQEVVNNNYVIVIGNKLYQTEGVGQLYVPEDTEVEFEGEITNVITFSDTSLAIFLENKVYEYQYDSDLSQSLGRSTFRLHPTKLQLGCKKGSEIIHTYDGSSIIMTTKKGVAVLNYQQFVQSTEQVYTFLSEQIDDIYEEFSGSYQYPIKITLYKDYIILYKSYLEVGNDNCKDVLVYDTRSQSWWRWTFNCPIHLIIEVKNKLNLCKPSIQDYSRNTLCMLDMNNRTEYKDNNTEPIHWKLKTQPLHFSYPNNYKHITRISILTDTGSDFIGYKLKFTTYRNLNNINDNDADLNRITDLSTVIKRINFVKANAFQLEMESSADITKSPLILSAIIIHYRITEEVR